MRIKLSYPLTLSQIAKATGGSVKGLNNDTLVSFVTTDTRATEHGDLYVALTGKSFEEGEFNAEAISKGAIVMTSKRCDKAILVKDTRDALLSLAAFYKEELLNLKHTVGITGSVGKSTTKEFLKALLSEKFITHATEKNHNNEIGLPLTILSAPRDCEVLIAEIGSNHYGEIKRLSECLKPDCAIITNIGSAHIGNFGSRECIAKEKCSIRYGMKKELVICEYGEGLVSDFNDKKTVSVEFADADLFLHTVKQSASGSVFDLYYKNLCIKNLELKLGGRHLLNSLGYALLSGLLLGLTEEEIRKGVSKIGEGAIRRRLIRLNDFSLLDDSYNSSLESVCADLILLKMYRGFPMGALIGDILELGAESERIHRELGGILARADIDNLYLFGVYSPFIKEGAISAGMNEKYIHLNSDTSTPEKTAKDILKNHKPSEIILCKASRGVALERITDILKRGDGND